jgi:hypothetical protein
MDTQAVAKGIMIGLAVGLLSDVVVKYTGVEGV